MVLAVMIAPCLELPWFAKYCKVCVWGVVFNIAYKQVTSVTESQRYGDWLFLTVEKNHFELCGVIFFLWTLDHSNLFIYFVKSQ